MRINVKTVRSILRNGGVRERKPRYDRVIVDEALLEEVYHKCDGYVQRMHEILTEEHHLAVGYSTLTRLVRSAGLGAPPRERACHMGDVPGEEMQHDTSAHEIRIGTSKRKLICCGLYLRYSKMRYVRFYRRFNRFTMKCFIDEALRHWGYCARYCIIDNTNLAVLAGTGSSAVMNPEAVAFADNYGFIWKAHALGHANRKAGKERNFYTIETNFFPGRTFSSLEDLNEQAYHWATVRYALRPQSKTKLIPVELFETEKNALIKLPDYIHSPYVSHKRQVDQYGYCSFDGNYYWIPEAVTASWITVLQYAHNLRIMDGTRELMKYPIAPDGVKNEMFVPPGHCRAPRGVPKNRKPGCAQEENRLLEYGEPLVSYLAMVRMPQNGVKQCPAFIRSIYSLSKRLGPSLFRAVIERALSYRVFDRTVLERIASQIIVANTPTMLSGDDISAEYRKRTAYLAGEYTQENNIDYSQFT